VPAFGAGKLLLVPVAAPGSGDTVVVRLHCVGKWRGPMRGEAWELVVQGKALVLVVQGIFGLQGVGSRIMHPWPGREPPLVCRLSLSPVCGGSPTMASGTLLAPPAAISQWRGQHGVACTGRCLGSPTGGKESNRAMEQARLAAGILGPRTLLYGGFP
jgi:hypothetical protein